MARLLALFLMLVNWSVAAADEPLLYVNSAASISFAKINCRAPAWKLSYPCETGDPTLEVTALISTVINHLAIDAGCRGVLYTTSVLDYKEYQKDHWELEVHIAFVDEHAPPNWQLYRYRSGSIDADWQGRDKPKEMAPIVCGIVSQKGAKPQ